MRTDLGRAVNPLAASTPHCLYQVKISATMPTANLVHHFFIRCLRVIEHPHALRLWLRRWCSVSYYSIRTGKRQPFL